MAYTVINFKTKKQLKEAVQMYHAFCADRYTEDDKIELSKISCFNPGSGIDLSNYTGKIYLQGPHYPEKPSWYAEAELVDGIVVKVS